MINNTYNMQFFKDKTMLKNLVIILIALTLSACTAHLKQSSFIKQDNNVVSYTADELNKWQAMLPDYEINKISLKSNDQTTLLNGIFLNNKNSQDVMFVIQGNGMKVSQGGIKMMKQLAQLNTDIVMFDRRGLGASNGQANIHNLISDASQQYDYIKNQLTPKSIIIHGYSLGSFIAAKLAKNKHVDALILQGSATNVHDWIDEKMPWYSKIFVTVKIEDVFNTIDNKDIVENHYSGPLLIIGADNDEQVPGVLSLRLFESSKSKIKKLIMVKNSNHGSMLEKPPEIALYKSFLNKL